MRLALVMVVALAGCEERDVAEIDGALPDGGDALIDTFFDSATIDTTVEDTGTIMMCKEQGVPCSIGETCCGTLVCGDRTGAMICSPSF